MMDELTRNASIPIRKWYVGKVIFFPHFSHLEGPSRNRIPTTTGLSDNSRHNYCILLTLRRMFRHQSTHTKQGFCGYLVDFQGWFNDPDGSLILLLFRGCEKDSLKLNSSLFLEAEVFKNTDLTPHRPCVHRDWLVWSAGAGVQCRWGWWGHWADDPHPPHQPQHHHAPHHLLEHISGEWVLLPVLVLCHSSFPCC